MPGNDTRKNVQTIDYLEDFPGADISRDVIEVAIATQDVSELSHNISQIGGQAQSAVDVASKIDAIAEALDSNSGDNLRTLVFDTSGTQVDPATDALEDALKSNDADEFVSRLVGADGLEVQEEALDTGVNATDVALLTYIARALNSQAQDELVSRLTDSTGSQIDPSRKTDFPDTQLTGQDVTAGDVTVGPTPVGRSEAVVIAVNETTGGTVSVSVDWEDGSGNVFQTESATDIGLDSVTEDWARLVRKGPQVEVTVTNVSSATSTNIHVDTER